MYSPVYGRRLALHKVARYAESCRPIYILLAAIKVSGGRLTCKLTPCSSRKSMQMIYVTNLCY